MQTLEQLFSGKLKGCKHLKLSCNLTTFPKQIFELDDTLEILDLSNNQLSILPENFSDLKHLKIAFFSDNLFTEFPKVLSDCPKLTMIGFKANKISSVPKNSFPKDLQWLILTDNKITSLPTDIGNCHKLQKVALAGNELKTLPAEMANCKNIELLRVSANQLQQFPNWLFTLPKLAWLAISGNPCIEKIKIENDLPLIAWAEIELDEILGQGASGIISKVHLHKNHKHAAVKIFKGEVTSDGFPEDEMNACIAAGEHPNLVKVIGKIENHPQKKQGLLLELIPETYKNLAGPPSFETCTRDTFKMGLEFDLHSVQKICLSVAEAAKHLHAKGIMHGDLYAHNTLIDEDANTIFGDFGAATIYNTLNEKAFYFERLDVRAFGYFMEDLLNQNSEIINPNKEKLLKIKDECLRIDILKRPDFKSICKQLTEI